MEDFVRFNVLTNPGSILLSPDGQCHRRFLGDHFTIPGQPDGSE